MWSWCDHITNQISHCVSMCVWLRERRCTVLCLLQSRARVFYSLLCHNNNSKLSSGLMAYLLMLARCLAYCCCIILPTWKRIVHTKFCVLWCVLCCRWESFALDENCRLEIHQNEKETYTIFFGRLWLHQYELKYIIIVISFWLFIVDCVSVLMFCSIIDHVLECCFGARNITQNLQQQSYNNKKTPCDSKIHAREIYYVQVVLNC